MKLSIEYGCCEDDLVDVQEKKREYEVSGSPRTLDDRVVETHAYFAIETARKAINGWSKRYFNSSTPIFPRLWVLSHVFFFNFKKSSICIAELGRSPRYLGIYINRGT